MKDIMACVEHHHNMVAELGYEVVMTVLIGSQNYDLADENSDIDTFSFIFPPIEDMAYARDLISGEFEIEDGKCMYKDIRLALNLLKKASPNSVECFVGKYRVFNPKYEVILNHYLNSEERIGYMVHSNYSHMLYAMAGMAHQLNKRNMPAGKRYSHALRLINMYHKFMDSLDTKDLLEMSSMDRDEAMIAKRDLNAGEGYYDSRCNFISKKLDEYKEDFYMTDHKTNIERMGQALICSFQRDLFFQYLNNNMQEGRNSED